MQDTTVILYRNEGDKLVLQYQTQVPDATLDAIGRQKHSKDPFSTTST